MNDKLYIVVRADLGPGLKLPQACHALRAFVDEQPELEREWFLGANNLVVLEVPDEPALAALRARSEARGLRSAIFREPDLGDAVTALALEPRAKGLVRRLPLAG